MVRVPRGDAGVSEPPVLLAAAALTSGAVAFVLARLALLPGLGFWDTAEFQAAGPLLGTAHPTGFPAYVILGWIASAVLVPFGDPAFRMNLLSAILVAGASAVTVLLVRQLTGHVWLALAGGLMLAAVPIAWNIGTHADAHALHLLLVALLLVLLVGWERRVRAGDRVGAGKSRASSATAPVARMRFAGDRWLMAAAVVFGISLANHTLTLLLAPGIGLFVLAVQPGIVRRPAFIGRLALGLVLATVLLYLELPLRAGVFRAPLVYGRPETLDGFFFVALGLQFGGAFYEPFADLGGKLGDLVQLGFDQFGPLAVLVPIGFVVTVLRRPRYALLTGTSFLITVSFAASYVNADISRYYLGPALMALTWIAILAAALVELLWRALGAEELDRPRGVMSPPLRGAWYGAPGAAALILELAVVVALLVPTVQALPDRRRTADLSWQREASDWAHTAMATFEPNAVVISWWSYSTTLWYVQLVEGRRPDVWIIDDQTRLENNLGEISDVIDAQLGKRPVYLVRLPERNDLAGLEGRYQLEEVLMPTEQSMHRVVGRIAP